MDAFEVALIAITVISLVLHAVKAKTKTKADDVAADLVDAAKPVIEKHRDAAKAAKTAK